MNSLIICRGLQASGKSTWAKEQVMADKTGQTKRINKDMLRLMLDNGRWSGKSEKIILACRDLIINRLMESNCHIIVDDTNLHNSNIIRIREVVALHNAYICSPDMLYEVTVRDFPITLAEAIERDAGREGSASVGEGVIRGTYHRYIVGTDLDMEDHPTSAEGEPVCI